MRVMIMHKTDARWESGATPGPELIARVEKMIEAMAEAGALLAAEGLRASSQGVRLRFSAGERAVTPGPFRGENELPAGFAILKVGSIDEAVEWASRFAGVLGDVEIDVRPVTEPWDLGLKPRPDGLRTGRFLGMPKADAATESGALPSRGQRAELGRLFEEMRRAGVLVAAEVLWPSSRGARLRSVNGRHTVLDGPFTESKELIGGYVILRVASLAEALAWAHSYADVVGCAELDVRPIADPPDWR